MTPGTYLRSLAPVIAVALGAIALTAFVLVVAGAGQGVVALVASIGLLGLACALAIDYCRKRPFYRELAEASRSTEQALWLVGMLERPDFIEGEIVYDSLEAISKAANDGVAEYRRQVADYREYIETWVHEAKSPLAAVHLMLENLEDALEEPRLGSWDGGAAGSSDGDPSRDASEKIRAVDDEFRRVEGYIEQALFYARSEAVERDYLIRRHSLRDLVAGAVKANASALIAARMAPVLENLDYEVFTDEKWMEFILGQVIQNSVKYARSEGASVSFTGRLADPGLSTERVELEIGDNGCGVSAADLPRVFDKGFTGENGRTGKRSTGIGLYLVKRLCDKMGVGIGATSREGDGFAITLRFSTNKFHYFDDAS